MSLNSKIYLTTYTKKSKKKFFTSPVHLPNVSLIDRLFSLTHTQKHWVRSTSAKSKG